MNVPLSETTLDLVTVLSGFALTMALFFGDQGEKASVVWLRGVDELCLTMSHNYSVP